MATVGLLALPNCFEPRAHLQPTKESILPLFIVTSFLLLICQPTGPEPGFNFVVWNVGQGSWSTYVDSTVCLHFDMGGEKAPWSDIKKNCQHKTNHLYLSHEDWDHIKFINMFIRRVGPICLNYSSVAKKPFTRNMKTCRSYHAGVTEIPTPNFSNDANENSQVYLLFNQVLLPGDANQRSERFWYKRVPPNTPILVLAHHGSKTSSSIELIRWMRPDMAIASARKRRYGHPHPTVKKRLKRNRVPLLTTEALGSLYFKIKTEFRVTEQ